MSICGAKENIIFVFVVTLWILMSPIYFLLPVYTDEIVWKALQGRVVFDELRAMTVLVMPSCGQYLFDVSPPLLPFLLIDGLLHADASPLAIRLSGFVIHGLLMVLVAWMIYGVGHFRGMKTWSFLLVFSGLMLGTLPFLLMLNRPEKMLLLLLTATFAMAINAAGSTHPRHGVLKAFTIALLGVWSLAVHPKAFFFLPFFLAAMVVVVMSLRKAAIPASALLAVAVAAFFSWDERLACKADAAYAKATGTRNAVQSLLDSDVVMFVKNLWWTVYSDPLDMLYLRPIFLKPTYMAKWLPGTDSPASLERIANLAVSVAIVVVFAALVAAVVYKVATLRRDSWFSRELLVVLAAILSLAMMSLGQPKKLDYDTSLSFPIVILALVGALASLLNGNAALAQRRGFRRLAAAVVLVVVAAATVSQIAVAARFGPHALAEWSRPGYLPDQPLSVSSVTSARAGEAVVRAAAACHVTPAGTTRRLVVDELTYAPFAATSEPYFITYLLGGQGGGWAGIPDLAAFLAEKGSAGAIVGCHRLPPALREQARQTGPYCCLGAFGAN